ncbi:Uncharacterized protein APZ42_014260 [Daphnia magna]|uniref:Uncharacterized protein n=1 Tax=Daphnia magna TaxID=35525 RepID=A0A0P5YLX3_9CRUS|nr:Uncharacterized protein APZ42_014260 [Daphnia magna]
MYSSTMFCCLSTNTNPFSQYSQLVNLANNQPSVLNASTPNTFTTQTTIFCRLQHPIKIFLKLCHRIPFRPVQQSS